MAAGDVLNGALTAVFFYFGSGDFLFKIPLKSTSKSSFFHFGVEIGFELQFLILFASFVVQSSAGTCFAQALQYKVLLGHALCKPCSTA